MTDCGTTSSDVRTRYSRKVEFDNNYDLDILLNYLMDISRKIQDDVADKYIDSDEVRIRYKAFRDEEFVLTNIVRKISLNDVADYSQTYQSLYIAGVTWMDQFIDAVVPYNFKNAFSKIFDTVGYGGFYAGMVFINKLISSKIDVSSLTILKDKDLEIIKEAFNKAPGVTAYGYSSTTIDPNNLPEGVPDTITKLSDGFSSSSGEEVRILIIIDVNSNSAFSVLSKKCKHGHFHPVKEAAKELAEYGFDNEYFNFPDDKHAADEELPIGNYL